MPFDPEFPSVSADPSQWWRTRTLPRILVQPNAPPNGASNNPADSDGIDDWFVPKQAPNPTDLPNDWIVPGAQTDASYPDDWIYPNNSSVPAAPSMAPPVPSPQPSVATTGISNRPTPPPDPFAAYWSLIPASRAGAMAWHPPIFLSPNQFSPENIPASAWVTPPPIFPNSLGQFPWTAPAPLDNPPSAAHGLLGGIEKMLAAPAPNPAAHGLLGGIAKMMAASTPRDVPSIGAPYGLLGALENLQPVTSNAQADASYVHGSRPFLSPDPIAYQGGHSSYATAGSTYILPATGNGPQPEEAPVQLAQALPPIFFARPPLLIPRQLTPLEELPPGSAGGQGAEKLFPRSFNEQQPEGVPCTYCGRPTTREPGRDRLHGDHVIPRVQGGNNDPKNFAPACRTCNLEKGARTPSEWYLWLRGGGAT